MDKGRLNGFFWRRSALPQTRLSAVAVLKRVGGNALHLAVVMSLAAGLNLPASVDFEESARAAHAMLMRLCDAHGGRLTGTPQSTAALEQLKTELRGLGLEPEVESFSMPGWQRRADSAAMIAPFNRLLRVAALSYSEPHPAFEAEVAWIGAGREEDYPADVRGKVLLLAQGAALQPRQFSRIAADRGALAIMQVNREGGGQLLARTGSFIGEPLPVPVYSITQEEGLWIRRLIDEGSMVRVRMQTESRCVEVSAANLRVVFPGRSSERIIVGAHFDSWDLGQGAVDNGLGVAQLFTLARALRGKNLPRTIELVWFDGEELGLWGSRHAASQLGDTPVVAMINLDMVGVPIAVNALGDTSLVGALERWNSGRAAGPLEKGVENTNWFGSDHTPYQLAGVRTITFNAPIPRESVRYYHDLADTIDKLPEEIVVNSAAVIGDLALALAADGELGAFRREQDETVRLFTDFKLERRMQAIGYWPFE